MFNPLGDRAVTAERHTEAAAFSASSGRCHQARTRGSCNETLRGDECRSYPAAVLTLLSVLAYAGLPRPADAQNAAQPALEEVVVTGSFIRRQSQFDSPAPLITVTSDDIGALGVNQLSDMIERLTINTGSQNHPDAFTQNFSTGTSNINLRGLGVGSTLVLLNGRRQTQSAVATDRGANFVDTSSLPPMIALDRVEIVKDGATALYGSEAVAGVANFITRSNFEGVEVGLDLQTVDGYPQNDRTLNALYGAGGDRTHVLAALRLLDREPLTTNDRRLSTETDDLSSGRATPAPFWSRRCQPTRSMRSSGPARSTAISTASPTRSSPGSACRPFRARSCRSSPTPTAR